ncbi:CPBP family intramembrane glutamic endopeptidase [Dinghuibacter silviterrae]|uniref:CAAX prenyl protease-like protein n=1 Tax=Dinghuibacter silviterrae TaxID=1539049 RepID=A0A4R8DV29_9BACT|nr:CPBP family intramembrane glutamic endopeptidase [Dinghuibacter silviterrae]TDX02039.1 CAAX prenyl protease-like protein [Dinghuibacter silviterrae]
MKRPMLGGVLLTLGLLALLCLCGSAFLRGLGLRNPVAFTAVARSLFCVWALVVWWHARSVEKQPLLLWKEERLTAGGYVLSILGLFGAVLVGVFVESLLFRATHFHEGLGPRMTRMLGILKAHHWLIFYSAVIAGVTEELTFRGYLLPRLDILTGRRWVAVLVTSIFFSLAHIQYGTVTQVAGTFVIGLVLALYYERYRNIKAAIVFHALWDIGAVFLLLHRLH